MRPSDSARTGQSGLRPAAPSARRSKRFPVVPLVIVATVAVALVGLGLIVQSVMKANAVPGISISKVSASEDGCLSDRPSVTFQVTFWNMGFANGVAHVSFYQDGSLLGSKEWAVPGRYPGMDVSVSYPISSCGGHTYDYTLDSVSGP